MKYVLLSLSNTEVGIWNLQVYFRHFYGEHWLPLAENLSWAIFGWVRAKFLHELGKFGLELDKFPPGLR